MKLGRRSRITKSNTGEGAILFRICCHVEELDEAPRSTPDGLHNYLAAVLLCSSSPHVCTHIP